MTCGLCVPNYHIVGVTSILPFIDSLLTVLFIFHWLLMSLCKNRIVISSANNESSTFGVYVISFT